MKFRLIVLALVVLLPCEIAHGAPKIGGGLPLDRGSDAIGWCPSSRDDLSLYNGAFTADGPNVWIRFTANIFRFESGVGWIWMRQRIDNVALVTQATYDAYVDPFECGFQEEPTLYFNRVPPGELLFFDAFHTALDPAWDTSQYPYSQYAYYVTGGCSGGFCSAPNDMDVPTYTGGSLGLGKSTDPVGSQAITSITIGGLTPGEDYNFSFWWRSEGDSDHQGELVVDIFGTEYWTNATSGPLNGIGLSRGVAWGDYDRDSDPDLFVSSNTLNKLYRNDGAGSFSDVSGGLGLGAMQGRAVSWVDYDNDEDLDLYLGVASGPNKLLRNDGGGAFVDATFGPLVGSDAAQGTQGQAWADYDLDGDLDLFLVTASNPSSYLGHLYRNDGPTSFVQASAGFAVQQTHYSGTWGDFDNDGDPDLFASGDPLTSKILRNDAGQLVAVPAADLEADVAAWGDSDNDGDLDLYVTYSYFPYGRLVRNDGAAGFVSVDQGAMVDFANGVAWLDADLDADLDLLVTTYDGNRLLLNYGNGTFESGDTEGPMVETWAVQGSAVADTDSDGDLDLYEAVYFSEQPRNRLFRNDHAEFFPQRNWLLVDLHGVQSNRFGVGAQIRVVTGAVRQLREVTAGSGNDSQNDLTSHFGLGSAATVDSLIVRWPSGAVQLLRNVAANQRLTITEPGPGWKSEWYALNNDYPEQSCWDGFDFANPEDPTLSSGALTLATSEVTENIYYTQTNVLTVPDTLLIEARLRVVSETHVVGNPRRGAAIFFTTSPDSFNVLFFGRDTVFIWSSFNQQGATAFVDTDDQFHNYLIEVRHHSQVLVYQDGFLILTGSIAVATGYVNHPYFWWGDGTDSGSGVSEWAYVRHNASTFHCGAVTGVPSDPVIENPAPRPVVSLAPPFPNPFVTATRIAYKLPEPSAVTLRVFDHAGRLIRVLVDGTRPAGEHEAHWDGTDEAGRTIPSGIYFVTIDSGTQNSVRKIVRLPGR